MSKGAERDRNPDPEALEETFREFKRVMGAMHKKFHSSMAVHGVTPPQFMVLRLLLSKGRMTPKEIASVLDVTPSNVTGIIDRLERDGLVSRTRGSKDRRVVYIRLTEDGRGKLEEMEGVSAANFASLFKGWTSGELDHFRELLARIQVGPGDEDEL